MLPFKTLLELNQNLFFVQLQWLEFSMLVSQILVF